jgi:hypothetical protein
VPGITIHESTDATGQRIRMRLTAEAGRLAVLVGSEVLPLPDGALQAVMKRYGKPLDVTPQPKIEEELAVGPGLILGRFRFLSRYDVIARDYIVLYAPNNEPLCELATSVAAALHHLARRFAAT